MLFFIEGFDHHDDWTDMIAKWDVADLVSGEMYIEQSGAYQRFSTGKYVRLAGTSGCSNAYIGKNITPSQEVVAGFAFMWENIAGSGEHPYVQFMRDGSVQSTLTFLTSPAGEFSIWNGDQATRLVRTDTNLLSQNS